MRSIRFLAAILGLLVSFNASMASANGYFRLGGMYTFSERGRDDLSKTTRTLLDIGGGYVWTKGWTLGGLYQMDKVQSDSYTLDRTSYGPTAGWISQDSGGPYVLATYFFSSKRSDEYEGSGYQFDLGYRFPVKGIFLALQMSYKHFAYNKANGRELDPPYNENYLDPYIALMFDF
ncbi:MAG TPA: hypothetical protein VM432_14600 [Bdellovibrionales bacterium]|jgi:hypothetical protein|nr:hypothetical protein [Bdellovibrionales bacterium]